MPPVGDRLIPFARGDSAAKRSIPYVTTGQHFPFRYGTLLLLDGARYPSR